MQQISTYSWDVMYVLLLRGSPPGSGGGWRSWWGAGTPPARRTSRPGSRRPGPRRRGGRSATRCGPAATPAPTPARSSGWPAVQWDRIKTNEIPHNKCWMSAPDGRSDTQTTQSSFRCVFISSGTAPPPPPSPLHSAAPPRLSILVCVSSGVWLSHFSRHITHQHSTTHRLDGSVMFKSVFSYTHSRENKPTLLFSHKRTHSGLYLVSKLVLGKGPLNSIILILLRLCKIFSALFLFYSQVISWCRRFNFLHFGFR